ncbi:threonine dehydrogenase-like Zn-dependent dehydrogenase [Granulicella aggregans]|uniref:Threonine dehydrogenase-like Zn-dependent dehydrogenase n=1 Tax=Granulicella aggregans TaxID=474949 RepID=A0A7W8E5K1_9BACT|nr:threonine dehydrogenase-like Zn-dependent dehydrogenase [Granulicella aggregans]
MKAVCWMGKSSMETRTVPDPELINPHDAIIKVTRTAICGSDLHLYDGFIPTMESGDIMGLSSWDSWKRSALRSPTSSAEIV